MSPGKCAVMTPDEPVDPARCLVRERTCFYARSNLKSCSDTRTAARRKRHNHANSFCPSLSILFRYHVPLLPSQLLCLACLLRSWVMCCMFTQIRPGEGNYGFTLEEKNRVPIIKSVEKGSPAEVGKCTHTHRYTYIHT